MSGHSKWSKIKHKKGLNDAKKGKVFSKMSQQITIAARDGGGDLDSNFTLRLLVDKAKGVSMPMDNIQRAIDKGSGKSGETFSIENAMYEGYGPAKVSMIVETLTDNKNRTVSDLRVTFSNHGGNLAESGSVSWNFTQKGYIQMRPAVMKESEKYGHEDEMEFVNEEEVIMNILDISGILDFKQYDETEMEEDEDNGKYINIYTEAKELAHVRDSIKDLGYVITSAELIWTANTPKKDLSEAEIAKVSDFIEVIEEMDEVQSIWTDVDDLLD